jgi:ubiquinone/menaquinone biosynthesis C-methylase UbiE
MKNNYDRVAWFYDLLGKVVFGNALAKSESSLVPFIPKNAAILIIGGGTGSILEHIAKQHSSGISITYVEVSEKMVRKAKRRRIGKNRVEFVVAAIEDYQTTSKFDAVITSFLFDNFKQEKAEHVFNALHQMLVPKGTWLFTDFYIGNKQQEKWKVGLLKSMYFFFKLFFEIETDQLPEMRSLFKNAGYRQIFSEFHFHKFIHSLVYQKP